MRKKSIKKRLKKGKYKNIKKKQMEQNQQR